MSKSIFILDNPTASLLYDYIYRNTKHTLKTVIMKWCFCVDFNSSTVFTDKDNRDDKDETTKWLYDLAFSYLAYSGIDYIKRRLYRMECIISNEPVLLRNSKASTVIFHLTSQNSGYVTLHDTKLNYLTNDTQYIVATFHEIC